MVVFPNIEDLRKSSLHFLSQHKFLAIALAGYASIIFYPTIVALRGGTIFGGDIGQYILTSNMILHHQTSIFSYPYPMLPLIYIPIVALTGNNFVSIYNIADLITTFLVIAIFLSMYLFIHKITKSDGASTASSLVIGTFPLILDEIGWGGQAQFLSIVFGLVALMLIVQYLDRNAGIGSLLGATFALFLSSITEPFVTAFFGLLVAIYFTLRFRRAIFCRKNISIAVAILGPAFLSVIFQKLSEDPNLEGGASSTLAFNLANVNSILLVYRIGYNNISVLLLYLVCISILTASYVILDLKTGDKRRFEKEFLVSSLVAFFLVALFVAPAQYADRGLYFLPIPFAMICGFTLFKIKTHASHAVFRYVVVIIVVLLLGGTITFAGYVYPTAISYYHLNTIDYQELSQFRSSNGSIVSFGNFPSAFPVADAAGNFAYEDMQPVWFITKNQVQSTLTASDLIQGIDWIDAGNLSLIDSTPVWAQPAPALFVSQYPYNVELFYLSDGLLPVNFSPASNRSIQYLESPFYASNTTSSYTEDDATIEHAYQWSYLNMSKTMTIESNGTVLIVLNYRFLNSVANSIGIRLISSLPGTNALINNRPNSSEVELLQSMTDPWLTKNYITDIGIHTVNSMLSTAFVKTDAWGDSEINSTIYPDTGVNQVTVEITAHVRGIQTTTPQLVFESRVLESSHIQWIVLSSTVDSNIIQRFRNDPQFSLYENLTGIIVYQVK